MHGLLRIDDAHDVRQHEHQECHHQQIAEARLYAAAKMQTDQRADQRGRLGKHRYCDNQQHGHARAGRVVGAAGAKKDQQAAQSRQP